MPLRDFDDFSQIYDPTTGTWKPSAGSSGSDKNSGTGGNTGTGGGSGSIGGGNAYTDPSEIGAMVDDVVQDLASSLGVDDAKEKVETSTLVADSTGSQSASYDPSTSTGDPSTDNPSTGDPSSGGSSSGGSPSGGTPSSGGSSISSGGGSGNVSAQKQYKEIEYNTLCGELSLVPTKKSLKVNVGDTVTLKGFGKYLSGKYFVESMTFSLSADSGFSQSLSVIKTGFGDNLKSNKPEKIVKEEIPAKVDQPTPIVETTPTVSQSTVTPTPTPTPAPTPSYTPGYIGEGVAVDFYSPSQDVPVQDTPDTDTSDTIDNSRNEKVPISAPVFTVGDKVRIVGDDAVYAKGCDGQKVPEWVKQQDLVIDAISDNGATARVNPIWSWTYTKYLVKI